MTVTGQKTPPYHREGLAQCLEQIRQAAAKGAIICREINEPWLMAQLCRIEGEVMQMVRNRT